MDRSFSRLARSLARLSRVAARSAVLLGLCTVSLPASAHAAGEVSPPSVAGSRGWVAIHAGQLWVCWEPGPQCWRRVVVEEPGESSAGLDDDTLDEPLWETTSEAPRALDLGRVRVGFHGPRQVWIDDGATLWVLTPGQRRAQIATVDPPTRLRRPTRPRCGPQGWVPVAGASGLALQLGPVCAPATVRSNCVSPGPFVRPRAPKGIDLKVGIELAHVRGWTTDGRPWEAAAIRERQGLEVLATVAIGFDPGGRATDVRRRAALLQRRRERVVAAALAGCLEDSP